MFWLITPLCGSVPRYCGRAWSNQERLLAFRTERRKGLLPAEREIPVWCSSCIFTEVLSPPFASNIWVALMLSLGWAFSSVGSIPKWSACSGELRIERTSFFGCTVRAAECRCHHQKRFETRGFQQVGQAKYHHKRKRIVQRSEPKSPQLLKDAELTGPP